MNVNNSYIPRFLVGDGEYGESFSVCERMRKANFEHGLCLPHVYFWTVSTLRNCKGFNRYPPLHYLTQSSVNMWRSTAFLKSSRIISAGSNVSLICRPIPPLHSKVPVRCSSVLYVDRNSRLQGLNHEKSPSFVRHHIHCCCCSRVGCKGTSLSRRHQSTTSKSDSDDEAQSSESLDELKIPGAEKGGRKLAIIFTCTHCNTRSAKQFTEKAYKYGVVIATCPGCKNKHLIADNLGFFADEEEGWNIETAMEKLGENVRVATTNDVFELSVEDIYTKEAIDEAVKNARDGNPKPDSSSG